MAGATGEEGEEDPFQRKIRLAMEQLDNPTAPPPQVQLPPLLAAHWCVQEPQHEPFNPSVTFASHRGELSEELQFITRRVAEIHKSKTQCAARCTPPPVL